MEIKEFTYMGHTFVPHGNIIGKDNETRFHRLMWRTDTLSPLISKKDGYDYYEFYRVASEAADIYYHPESKSYYVPIQGGLCRIDEKEQRKYIKKLKSSK